MEIVFLGSGGGRFVMVSQRRRTGGFLIKSGDFQIHVDPGPGALVNSWEAKENPMKTTHILVSHMHTDHYVDSPAVVEAMTEGTRERRGVLVGSRMFLEGYEGETPGISEYHKNLVEKVIVSEPDKRMNLGKFQVVPTRTEHNEPTGTGFVFYFDDLTVGYTSDGAYFDGQEDYFKGADALVLNSILPDTSHVNELMGLGDAIKLVSLAKPRLAILNHFGMRALRFGPERMAGILANKTGIRSLASRDFLKLNLDEELKKKGLTGWLG